MPIISIYLNVNGHRHVMNLLILSTLPHYIVLLVGPTKLYNSVVFCSSSLSVLWHYSDTPATSLLGTLDHLFALFWLLADCYYFWETRFLQRMLLINGISFLAAQVAPHLLSYYVGHSIWHLLSVAKSVYLAYLLRYSILV
jgi:hypothetical protein